MACIRTVVSSETEYRTVDSTLKLKLRCTRDCVPCTRWPVLTRCTKTQNAKKYPLSKLRPPGAGFASGASGVELDTRRRAPKTEPRNGRSTTDRIPNPIRRCNTSACTTPVSRLNTIPLGHTRGAYPPRPLPPHHARGQPPACRPPPALYHVHTTRYPTRSGHEPREDSLSLEDTARSCCNRALDV